MGYEINIKEIEDIVVTSERFVGGYEDNVKHCMNLYKKYWRYKQGAFFSLYYDNESPLYNFYK